MVETHENKSRKVEKGWMGEEAYCYDGWGGCEKGNCGF